MLTIYFKIYTKGCMNIDQYMKHANYTVGDFCRALKMAESLVWRYRKKHLRPSFLNATRIVNFSRKLITFEELGRNPDGESIIPWTQKELRNNLNGNGSQIHNTLSADTMDAPEKEGTVLLQSKEYRERERHCVY